MKTFYSSHSVTFTPHLLSKFLPCSHQLVCVFVVFRFAPSVCAVRVVEPLNLGSPGMPSGHMTSPCVMTVPNSLLKVSGKHVELIIMLTVEEWLYIYITGIELQQLVNQQNINWQQF